MKNEKTLLLFAHHSTEDSLPEESLTYLSHLKEFFSDILVVCDNPALKDEDYEIFYCENVG